jgi:hypothetical protein
VVYWLEMIRTAALKTTRDEKVRDAKRAFILGLLDLSWKMAAVMLLPIFVGLYIDSRSDQGQTFTLLGFVVGMIGAVLVIRSIVRGLAK